MANARALELFRRADIFEQAVCLLLNRGCSKPGTRQVLVAVSRLGDGMFWYLLLLLLPVAFGSSAILPAARMVVIGGVGVAIYKGLKSRLVRERPFISLTGIVVGTPPLDRYSFPSGHTLHAVAFTVLAVSSFPVLAWLLVPFALLVATSRVVLGLHYPSDVLAGAAIGALLALTAMWVWPI
jgi:undecaprenyl-diphosphatase